MTLKSIFISAHPQNPSIFSEGFDNTLACMNNPYCYINIALCFMDMVQYKPNGLPEFCLDIFVCMKYIYFVLIGQKTLCKIN